MRKLLHYLWASPCTLVGMVAGAVFLAAGGSARMEGGVIEISLPPRMQHTFLSLGAITFGHVVLGISKAELERLRTHELEHVRQYERWGLLFFLAYPASSLVQFMRGKNPYWYNHFEIQARQRSAGGPDHSVQAPRALNKPEHKA
ncbi:MAG: hypothetical protein PSX71_08305 [bacterium]|nr:hypothetical protein [bacterium]